METSLWKILIVLGLGLIILGLILYLFSRGEGSMLGRLPGDIVMKRKNFTFYFPLASSIVLSLVLSLLFYWLRKHL